jgi:hypothetical protein
MTHNNIYNIIFSCLSFFKITLMCMELVQQCFLKKEEEEERFKWYA